LFTIAAKSKKSIESCRNYWPRIALTNPKPEYRLEGFEDCKSVFDVKARVGYSQNKEIKPAEHNLSLPPARRL
jgi:hypothetical protein